VLLHTSHHLQADLEESDGVQEPCGLDREEFHEAFCVFSNDSDLLLTTTSVLHPFLKSLGLRDRSLDAVANDAKQGGNHSISEDALFAIVTQHVCRLKESWPSHPDVLKAFRVFDSEGVGFIKVTLLKRFLVQAQLEVDDSVCEYGQLSLGNIKLLLLIFLHPVERLIHENCQIDGDDLINYEGGCGQMCNC